MTLSTIILIPVKSTITDSSEMDIIDDMEMQVTTTTKRSLPDRCLVRTETGPCKHYIHKWTFIKAEGKCRTFVYGGCLGNENRFNSQLECLHYCVGGPNCEFIYYPEINYISVKRE